MKTQRNNKGQAMVEYIIIVVLIAITLIVLFTKFGRGIGESVTGATKALSDTEGDAAVEAFDSIGDENNIKNFQKDGTFK